MHFEAHFLLFLLAVWGKFSFDNGGVNKKFSCDKGGSIKCPAGGGIQTLPFRRGVTVPFPPMPTYGCGFFFCIKWSHKISILFLPFFLCPALPQWWRHSIKKEEISAHARVSLRFPYSGSHLIPYWQFPYKNCKPFYFHTVESSNSILFCGQPFHFHTNCKIKTWVKHFLVLT